MYRILYVDDEQALLELGKFFLEETGEFTVDTSVSAVDSLQREDLGSYDAIISDYQMPGMDGIAFLKEVRSRFSKIPFILFTGRGREFVVIEALNNGADFYLQKGGEPEAQFVELSHKVKYAVSQRKAEEALHGKDLQIRTLFENIPVGMFQSTADGKFIYVNEAISTMLGYDSPAELIEAVNRTSIAHALYENPGQRPLFVEEVVRGEGSWKTFGNRYRKKDGTIIDAILSFAELKAPSTGEKNLFGFVQDITESKRKEDKLRESEKNLEDLVQNLHAGVVVHAPDTRVLLANGQASRLLGIGTARMMGKMAIDRLWEFTREDGTPLPVEEYPVSVVLSTGLPLQDRVYGISHPSSHDKVWLLVNAFPQMGHGGQVSHVVVTFVDITGRKRAENALKESESKFREIFNNATDAIEIIEVRNDGLPGMFIEVNDASCRMVGYTREELLEMNPFDINTGTYSRPLEEISRELRARKHVSFETEHRRKDGTIIPVEINTHYVMIQEKKVFLSMVRDIRERKVAEMKLRDREKNLLAMMNSINEAAFLMTPQGTVLAANNTVAERLGFSGGDTLKGKNILDLLPPEVAKGRSAAVSEAVSSGKPVTYEDERSGHIILQSINPVTDHSGRVTAVSVVGVDITERKRVEEQLRQNELILSQSQQIAHVGSWVLYPADNQLSWSDETYRIFGLEPQEKEMTLEMFFSFVHPDDREAVNEAYFSSLREGKDSYDIEHRIVMKKSGEVRHLHERCVHERNTAGVVVRSIGMVQDITDRKRTEETLLLEKTFIDAILNSVPGMLYVYDSSSRLVRWNRNHELMTGYSAKELSGMHLLDWYRDDPVSQKAVTEGVRRTLLEGFGEAEADLQKKDGTKIPMYFTASTMTLNGEQYFAGIGIDVSERKRAEEALVKNERYLKAILQTTIDGFWVLDAGKGGMFIDANDAYCAMSGYTREELAGLYINDIDAVEDRSETEARIKRIMQTGSELFETRHRRKDGRLFDLEVSVTYIDSDGGKFICFCRDITSRRQAEEALKESEKQYRALVSNTPDIIMRFDREHRHLFVNDAVSNVVPFKPGDFIGKTHREMGFPEELCNYWEECIDKAFATGKPVITEFSFQGSSGKTTFDWRLIPEISDSGSVSTILAVSRDISERKRVEDALRQTNRQLKLLGSITRHDINNKVSVILGNLAIATKKSGNPAMEDFINRIKSATVAIQSQIEFTKLYQDLGTHEPEWQDVDALLPRSHVPSGITMDARVAGTEIYADPMLRLVFSNLLDNSVRHGEHVSEIRVYTSRSDEGLMVVWEDNGAGIPGADKEKVFERGFGKNTGLGLFLVREILSLTDITITETGEPGRGARFEIMVPEGKYRYGTHG